MRPNTLLKALFALQAVVKCHARISWTRIGCDSDGAKFKGVSLDDMWDNALQMAQNARSKLTLASDATFIKSGSDENNAAHNTKMMWGTSYSLNTKKLGLTSASKATLADVDDVYGSVETILTTNKGFVICDQSVLTWGNLEPYWTSGTWYYSFPGSSDVFIVRFANGASLVNGQPKKPCDFKGDGPGEVGARQFTGQFKTTVTNDGKEETVVNTVNAILICTHHWLDKWSATRELGFAVTEDQPNPDDYDSGASTVLHEMIHAIDESKYKDHIIADFKDGVGAYGTARSGYLAQVNLGLAKTNPDNYAIFATMCMSPSTRWYAPERKF